MKKGVLILFASLLLFGSCQLFRPTVIYQEYDKIPDTKNRNTCKFMTDSVLVYAIFVDVDSYHPWTEFDIRSTMDSLKKATNWLQSQAGNYSHSVQFEPVQYKDGGRLTIYERSVKVNLSHEQAFIRERKSRFKKWISWSDAIAKKAGKGLKYIPSSKVSQRLKIVNVQTLNQALRDKYKRENVAILFFVNGYYEDHPSYSFHTESDRFAEYSIITNKNPAVISHEILHLFGAVDLYPNKAYPNFNFKELAEKFPDEVMRIQHKEISRLSVSPITAYFIGWQDSLDKPNTRLLLHKYDLKGY